MAVVFLVSLHAPAGQGECKGGKGWQERVVYFRVKGRAKPFACHLREVAPLMEWIYRRIYGEVEVIHGYKGPLEAPPTLKGKKRAALAREINDIARKMGQLGRSYMEGKIPYGRYMREYRRLWDLYWRKVLRLWAVN